MQVNRKKKILTLELIMVLLLSMILAGCAGSGVTASSAETKQDEANSVGAAPTEQTATEPAKSAEKKMFAYVNTGEYKCYVDRKGEIVFKTEYENPGDFSCGLARVMRGSDQKWGYIDITGKVVIEPQFGDASHFSDNGLANVRLYNEGPDTPPVWGYINTKGDFAIKPQFRNAQPFINGAARVCADEMDIWDYINEKGEYITNSQFEIAFDFTEDGLAIVAKDRKYGFIDKSGAFIIKPQFDNVDAFAANGLARAHINGSWGYIDKTGTFVISSQYAEAGNFSKNGLAGVRTTDGLYGYIDSTGKFVIEPQYKRANSFSESGLAIAYTDENSFGLIDETGKFITKQKYNGYLTNDFSNGLAVVESFSVYGYMNRNEEMVINSQFKEAERFDEYGLAWVMTRDDKWGCINTKGEYVIKPEYVWHSEFREIE